MVVIITIKSAGTALEFYTLPGQQYQQVPDYNKPQQEPYPTRSVVLGCHIHQNGGQHHQGERQQVDFEFMIG